MTKFTELPENASPAVIKNWIQKEIFNGDLLKLTKTKLRERIKRLDGPKFVDANFTEQYRRSDVLIKVPPSNDLCLRLVPSHYLLVPKGKELKEGVEILCIPLHYRRTLTIENGVQIFRNFYTDDEKFLGEMVIADVTIQIKVDLISGKETLVLDYENIRPKSLCRAAYELKIGTLSGQVAIPGTPKFVNFKKLNK